MVEFGEKIKQLREEQGMTQQSMAEKLYVTRQAVSRWECGARYPDLLTTKKIAQILGTSIDELLSGEELRENIEKEPVLAQPVENRMQTILYTIASIAYLLMCIFSLYSLIRPNEALAHTPAGKISLTIIISMAGFVLNFGAVFAGLVLSVNNKLTAKITGYIMWLPYIMAAISFLVTYIEMQIKRNGQISVIGWMTDFFLPLLFAIYVLVFFESEGRRLPYEVILLICILSVGYIGLVIKNSAARMTDLGFVIRTVHCLGKLGMIFLLGYQAYVWNKKKVTAYKEDK